MADERHPLESQWDRVSKIAQGTYYIGLVIAGMIAVGTFLLPRLAPFWLYFLTIATVLVPIPVLFFKLRMVIPKKELHTATLLTIGPWTLVLIMFASGEFSKLADVTSQDRVVTALEKDSETASNPVTLIWRKHLDEDDSIGRAIRMLILYCGALTYCLIMLGVLTDPIPVRPNLPSDQNP